MGEKLSWINHVPHMHCTYLPAYRCLHPSARRGTCVPAVHPLACAWSSGLQAVYRMDLTLLVRMSPACERTQQSSVCSVCPLSSSQEEARELLKSAPGITVIDDRGSNTFPTPLDVSMRCLWLHIVMLLWFLRSSMRIAFEKRCDRTHGSSILCCYCVSSKLMLHGHGGFTPVITHFLYTMHPGFRQR